MPGAEDPDFEQIYARAGGDLAAIPWATLGPNPALVNWLASQPALGERAGAAGEGEARVRDGGGAAALVVACGLGDDAEELARLGYGVTAFDFSPTAIELCHERFPSSEVEYRVADVFELPTEWTAAFALVVEIRTLQSLPLDHRRAAVDAIAGTVEPGGWLFVRTAGREPDEPLGSRPWPLTRAELDMFIDAGLAQRELRDDPAGAGRFRTFIAVYQRASATT